MTRSADKPVRSELTDELDRIREKRTSLQKSSRARVTMQPKSRCLRRSGPNEYFLRRQRTGSLISSAIALRLLLPRV